MAIPPITAPAIDNPIANLPPPPSVFLGNAFGLAGFPFGIGFFIVFFLIL